MAELPFAGPVREGFWTGKKMARTSWLTPSQSLIVRLIIIRQKYL
jgi:hypothetical protein